MKSDKLQDAIGEVRDDYILDANTKTVKKRNIKARWIAAAACLCLVVGSIIVLTRFGILNPSEPIETDPVQLEALPKITIPDYYSEGAGFEGYMQKSADELENGNPWREDLELETMPVYKNGCYDPSGKGEGIGLSETEIMDKLMNAAQVLGLEVEETTYDTNATKDLDGTIIPGDTVWGIRAVTDQGSLSVRANGRLLYRLPGDFMLPEGYHFTGTGTSKEEAEAALEYLAETYADLLEYSHPKIALRGEYTFNGDYSQHYIVYDAGTDITESILNYCIRYAEFYPNDNNEGSGGISVRDGLVKAEKIGDYPLISVSEAQEKLLAGQYQTNVPAAVQKGCEIAKVELVYRTGVQEEFLLPYYRFYIELPEDSDPLVRRAVSNGLKTFGAYYVPAIKDEYIYNQPSASFQNPRETKRDDKAAESTVSFAEKAAAEDSNVSLTEKTEAEDLTMDKKECYILKSEECALDITDFDTSGFYMEGDGELNGILGVYGDTVYFLAHEHMGEEVYKNYICTGKLAETGGPVSILCEIAVEKFSTYVGMVKDSIYVLNMSLGKTNYSSLWRYDAEGNGRIVQEWETVNMPAVFPCGDDLICVLCKEDGCEVLLYHTAEDSAESLFGTDLVFDRENALFTGEYIISAGTSSPEGFLYSTLYLEQERSDASSSPCDVFYYDLQRKEARFLFTSEKKLLDLTGDEECQFYLEYDDPKPPKNPFIIRETGGITQRLEDPDLNPSTKIQKSYQQGTEYMLSCSGIILQINTAAREITKYYPVIQGIPEDTEASLTGAATSPINTRIRFTMEGESGEWMCIGYENRYLLIQK